MSISKCSLKTLCLVNSIKEKAEPFELHYRAEPCNERHRVILTFALKGVPLPILL